MRRTRTRHQLKFGLTVALALAPLVPAAGQTVLARALVQGRPGHRPQHNLMR